MTPPPRPQSILTPTSNVAARALAALVAAHGGTLTLSASDVLNAPSRLDLTTTDGQMTFTAQSDAHRIAAATVVFDRWTTVELHAWTAATFGQEFVITGTLARTPIWPTVGDHVSIQRLSLPGRGALEDITGRVTISNRGNDIALTIGLGRFDLKDVTA